MPESSVQLISRDFLTGDVVKRSLVQSKSGVITNLRVEAQVEHVLSRQRLDAWIPQEKLKSSLIVERKDKVFYDEWVGSVEDVSRVLQSGLGYAVVERLMCRYTKRARSRGLSSHHIASSDQEALWISGGRSYAAALFGSLIG